MQQDDLNDEHVTILELGTNTMQELAVNGRTLVGIRDERLYLDPHHAVNFMYAISGDARSSPVGRRSRAFR